MPFDRESGQIYNESFTALPKKDEDDLVYVDQRGHTRARPEKRRPTQGTRTLYRMAILSILRSLDLLYPDLLAAYPLPILEQIWKSIYKNRLDGLRMWKLFAHVHLMDKRLVKRPQSTFIHAIGQGSSIEHAWLTDLTLDTIPLTMPEYVHVSSMPNLASLAVIAGNGYDTGFSDRMLRSWASDAKTGSFSRLQHMFVSGHRYITEQSLAYLDGFKVLDLFCAHNCRLDLSSEAGAEGWHDLSHGNFRAYLKTKSTDYGRINGEAPFPSSFHAYVALCRRLRDASQNEVPHLLMTLLPGSLQNARTFTGRYISLHCFERCEASKPSVPNAIGRYPHTRHKRRKLKDGKARDLAGMLEGLS